MAAVWVVITVSTLGCQVIDGWDAALMGMTLGETATVKIGADMAYADKVPVCIYVCIDGYVYMHIYMSI